MDGKTLPGSEMVKVTGGCGLMKRVSRKQRENQMRYQMSGLDNNHAGKCQKEETMTCF